MTDGTAAIVTVGSELVEGLRVDTNTAEIARALGSSGFRVVEAVSVGDRHAELVDVFRRLVASHEMVICTGGLGPTHDDITRDAAAEALCVVLQRDERIAAMLNPAVAGHTDPEATRRMLVQADVLPGSEVIDPTTGSAPGLIVPTPKGSLVLLPGPPKEMRPMLATLAERYRAGRANPADLGVHGMTESDAQLIAQSALEGHDGISLTVLAKPGDVRVILVDEGAGASGIATAAADVAEALGEACYSTDGSTLAQALVRASTDKGITFALAESCTGGLIAGEVTAVPGASEAFAGGVVSYSNQAKEDLLGVPKGTIERFGAVSSETAVAMAEGARQRFGTTVAASVTGIAGPGGGTADKPVGLVWFGFSGPHGSYAIEKRFRSSGRDVIRQRSVATVLNLLWREVAAK